MTDSEKIILEFIAENGPASAYDVYTQTELIKQTARAGLKRLHKKGLLSSHEEPAEKSPHPKKMYSLTPLGILKAVGKYAVTEYETEIEMDIDMVEDLAKTHGDVLPLILGKYNFYKQQGFEDVIPIFLERVFENDFDLLESWESDNYEVDVTILFYYQLIDDLVKSYLPSPSGHPFKKKIFSPIFRGSYDKTWREILDLLAEDEDVKARIMSELKRRYPIERGYEDMDKLEDMVRYFRKKVEGDFNQDKSKENGDEED